MGRYAIIENGVVANIAVADAEFADEQGWTAAPAAAAIGWLYSAGQFSAPPPSPPPVPQSITPAQAKIALYAAGLLDEVEAIIAAAAVPTQIMWANALEFRREDERIAQIAAALTPPLTEQQVDDLFRAGPEILP